MGKCKHTRMFMISIFSSQCNYPMKRQEFYRLVSFAQNTDVHTSGKNGETPRLTKTITCTMGNFVPLVVPRLSSSSCSSSASISRPKGQSNSSGESETSSDPVTTRSAKRAWVKLMQSDLDKLASGNRGPAHKEDEMNKEDPTQGIPDWLQPFTV